MKPLTIPLTRRFSSPSYQIISSHGWSSTAPKSTSGSALARLSDRLKGRFSPSSSLKSTTAKVPAARAPTLTVNCNPVLFATCFLLLRRCHGYRTPRVTPERHVAILMKMKT
ncbi:hypothetical protein Q7O_004319 [Pectobacterium carotovorum subsp. carotovorum PCCS1]|nr:hypothetical protein [Pectobacterium carotovorum subsp. carotovorum PCCS1]